MEAESERIEAQKNRERRRIKRETPVVRQETREEVIEKQNQQDHLELKDKLKFRAIVAIVLAVAMLIYVVSLSEYQRTVLTEDTILWAIAGGLLLVVMFKKK